MEGQGKAAEMSAKKGSGRSRKGSENVSEKKAVEGRGKAAKVAAKKEQWKVEDRQRKGRGKAVGGCASQPHLSRAVCDCPDLLLRPVQKAVEGRGKAVRGQEVAAEGHG